MSITVDPDLTFYYHLNLFDTEVTFETARSLGFIKYSKLLSDYKLKNVIGSITYTGTYAYLDKVVTSSNFATIRLPQGDINCLLQRSNFSDTLDYAILPGTYYLPITGGSNDFAFARGTIALVVLETQERIMYVYFTK